MRIDAVKRELETSGPLRVSSAKVKASAKIFDMFANDTYANKPLAIMRELVANGVDAHVAAGCPQRPVKVTLPTALEPTCRVQDFGIGMSQDFVMGPFMEYTNGSTKDQDDSSIGGFGIGSKSPFSYVDQFTLRVVHDGVLSIYTMFKNEDGIPAVGLQGETTTTEGNGVEVSFPVEADDVQTFHEAAQEALQYFMPVPEVANGKIDPPDYTFKSNNWAIRPKAGELGIIMGGVRYPVKTGNLSYVLQADKRLAPLLAYGLDITLPIGACGVAMSREQLSYTSKTSASIQTALEDMIDDVVATFANYFDGCATEWDAMVMLVRECGIETYGRSSRAQLLLNNAHYKGKKLEVSFKLNDSMLPDTKAWFCPRKTSRRWINVPNPKWGDLSDLFSITPGMTEAVVIDDLPPTPKSKSVLKIKEFIAEQPQAKDIIVIRSQDVAKVKMLLRGPTDVVLTSSLPEPAKGAARVKTVRPRVRMFTFNGLNDKYTHQEITNLTPAASKEQAVKEIAHADQPTSGIMVIMNSFDLPGDFHNRMKSGLFAWQDLVFVNAGDAPKLASTFVDFDKEWEARLKTALSATPDLPARLALSDDPFLSDVFRVWRDLAGYVTLTPQQEKRPFGRIVKLYQDYVLLLTDAQRRLSPFVGKQLPKGVDPQALAEAFEKQQAHAHTAMSLVDVSKESQRNLFLSLI